MRAQYKIYFDRPPRLKKLPEVLIISPELRHLYIHTYIQTDTENTNRNLDRLYTGGVRNTTAKQYGSTIYKFCKEC